MARRVARTVPVEGRDDTCALSEGRRERAVRADARLHVKRLRRVDGAAPEAIQALSLARRLRPARPREAAVAVALAAAKGAARLRVYRGLQGVVVGLEEVDLITSPALSLPQSPATFLRFYLVSS